MEFIKTKLYGEDINVIFIGPKYFFYSKFYGLIAHATRINKYDEPTHFEVTARGGGFLGGSFGDFCKVAERVIKKNENAIINQEVEITFIKDADLHKKTLQINVINY